MGHGTGGISAHFAKPKPKMNYDEFIEELDWDDPECPKCESRNTNLLVEQEHDSGGYLIKIRRFYCRDCCLIVIDPRWDMKRIA